MPIHYLQSPSKLNTWSFVSFISFTHNRPTMSAKSPWNTHTMLGIFQPCPIFAAAMTIVSLLPPSYNVKSIDEALSYLESHHFSIQCYSCYLQTTFLYRGGNFVFRLQQGFSNYGSQPQMGSHNEILGSRNTSTKFLHGDYKLFRHF